VERLGEGRQARVGRRVADGDVAQEVDPARRGRPPDRVPVAEQDRPRDPLPREEGRRLEDPRVLRLGQDDPRRQPSRLRADPGDDVRRAHEAALRGRTPPSRSAAPT
jgi:hypothetical protein